MKNLFVFAGILTAAFSSATLFNTTVFTTADNLGGNPNLTPSYVSSGDTFTANLNNALIGGTRTWLDVTWWHTFDTTVGVAGSPSSAAYTGVTQTMTGFVRRTDAAGDASFSASLTENTLNNGGGSMGSSNPFYTFSQSIGTTFVPFTFSGTTLFSAPMTSGLNQKDNLVIAGGSNMEIVISSITQTYTPVPEPATMSVLALGAVGLLRRRFRK